MLGQRVLALGPRDDAARIAVHAALPLIMVLDDDEVLGQAVGPVELGLFNEDQAVVATHAKYLDPADAAVPICNEVFDELLGKR